MTKQKAATKHPVQKGKTAKAAVTADGRGNTKLAQLEAMLRRPHGATVEQISKSLAWQAHSVRGAISGSLKKKQGLTVINEKADDGRRVYRIA